MASFEAASSPEVPPSHREEKTGHSFHEFEQTGWEDQRVIATYDEHLSRVTTQSLEAVLDAVGVREGSRVLDVAAGAGYIASAAAARGAHAIGIDFSAAQVQMARERHPHVRFEHADAEALPFDSDSFDAVVSGFGMCHLPNPDRALGEAFRVLRHGGGVSFTVWASPERAIVFGALYAAIRAHGRMDVGLPAGPNFFLFSDPEQCARALSGAGFVSPSCREVPQVWRVTDPDDLFEVISRGSVRAAATLRAQSPTVREAIKEAMRAVVMSYGVGDCFEVPAPAVLATAVKP